MCHNEVNCFQSHFETSAYYYHSLPETLSLIEPAIFYHSQPVGSDFPPDCRLPVSRPHILRSKERKAVSEAAAKNPSAVPSSDLHVPAIAWLPKVPQTTSPLSPSVEEKLRLVVMLISFILTHFGASGHGRQDQHLISTPNCPDLCGFLGCLRCPFKSRQQCWGSGVRRMLVSMVDYLRRPILGSLGHRISQHRNAMALKPVMSMPTIKNPFLLIPFATAWFMVFSATCFLNVVGFTSFAFFQ